MSVIGVKVALGMGIIAMACTFPWKVQVPSVHMAEASVTEIMVDTDNNDSTATLSTSIPCNGCNPLVFGLQLNVNCASDEQLQALPKIGPALASRILEYRQKNGDFQSLSDLDSVKGIGPKTLAKIQPQITVQPSSTCRTKLSSSK